MYVDFGVKDKNTEFHINFTGAETALGVVGPTPTQLLAQDYGSVFTSPQTTNNRACHAVDEWQHKAHR